MMRAFYLIPFFFFVVGCKSATSTSADKEIVGDNNSVPDPVVRKQEEEKKRRQDAYIRNVDFSAAFVKAVVDKVPLGFDPSANCMQLFNAKIINPLDDSYTYRLELGAKPCPAEGPMIISDTLKAFSVRENDITVYRLLDGRDNHGYGELTAVAANRSAMVDRLCFGLNGNKNYETTCYLVIRNKRICEFVTIGSKSTRPECQTPTSEEVTLKPH